MKRSVLLIAFALGILILIAQSWAAWGGVCETGKHQSPIDLQSPRSTIAKTPLEFFHEPISLKIQTRKGLPVIIDDSGKNGFVFGKNRWVIEEIRFKSPS